ncbi:hypothetical protein LTS18_010749 [Coniosporium uncinatum]|uniref:Uncharacterized protein n=1 Tax=Coniosporium uncinatum TaxID=93489 RepID=A0ACC3CZ65_9PEZI|nr:hypothetical protein LTS18_010749 [Coniosporium uncinatum]
MATPYRQANGVMATPAGAGAAMRTPRDSLNLNRADGMQLVGQTPRDIRLQKNAVRQDLRAKLSSLPAPKETDWELELPEEQQENSRITVSEEDAAVRDDRNEKLRRAKELADFRRQTQVVQKGLPRPSVVGIDAMLKKAADIEDPVKRAVATEAALLIANDALKFGDAKVTGSAKPVEVFDEDSMNRAKMEVALELSASGQEDPEAFEKAWMELHGSSRLPGLDAYAEDEIDEHQLMVETFDNVQQQIMASAERGNKIEKKLNLHLGGYQQRAKTLRQKIMDAAETLEKTEIDLESRRIRQAAEEAAITKRLERLREEVAFISRREREAQELYRARKEELDGLTYPTNGTH